MADEEMTGGDVRWMSYRELADFMGVSLASAQRHVIRAKWKRQEGNDKKARVAVPLVDMARIEARRETRGKSVTPDKTSFAKAALNMLQARLEAAEAALATQTKELAEVREDRARLAAGVEGMRPLLARLDAAETDLAAKTRELAEAREERERAVGELDGMKTGAEHLHEVAAQARREATEAQRRAIEAEQAVARARGEKEVAEAALAKLRDRGLLARVLNREG